MKKSFVSPLRYPGGKAKLGSYFARLLASQSSSIRTYAEPYAGGAGAGLFLLTEGHVDKLLINDLNPGIAAFWRSVVYSTDEIIDRIESDPVDLNSWFYHRNVYLNPESANDTDLGFATFFLNRCNRSGILTARPIGGLEQTGNWKIDARFNRDGLVSRIRLIATFASQISVTEKPAVDFITGISRRRNPVLLYADPPYLIKGEKLYMSDHSWADHESLAKTLTKSRHPWILTYDFNQNVRDLYPNNRCLGYSISHTAHSQKVGRELMLFSRDLRVGDLSVSSNRTGQWVS